MDNQLEQYKTEMEQELLAILHYWSTHTQDTTNGGFIGRINHNENRCLDAPKGSVLNSRILWSFSSAYYLTKKEEYNALADKAFAYLVDYFTDSDYGGVYWTVDYAGTPLDTKKQIYAQAFALYGLSEYSRATGNEKAKGAAIRLYHAIVCHSHDPVHGGYGEALTRSWQPMHDIRLSPKDANEKKSMNTHLHVLEAFANLHRIWPDVALKEKITELIQLFLRHIVAPSLTHLHLFFDETWKVKSNTVSYGHDIEASWLLQEAAAAIGDNLLLEKVKKYAVTIAVAAADGLDSDGGLWYEYNVTEKHLVKEKHWWPQAEAMVGFFNTWQLTGDTAWLQRSLHTWQFVQRYIRDNHRGEWYWGVDGNNRPLLHEDKVGIWKCPYHNSRACIEIISRIERVLANKTGAIAHGINNN